MKEVNQKQAKKEKIIQKSQELLALLQRSRQDKLNENKRNNKLSCEQSTLFLLRWS